MLSVTPQERVGVIIAGPEYVALRWRSPPSRYKGYPYHYGLLSADLHEDIASTARRIIQENLDGLVGDEELLIQDSYLLPLPNKDQEHPVHGCGGLLRKGYTHWPEHIALLRIEQERSILSRDGELHWFPLDYLGPAPRLPFPLMSRYDRIIRHVLLGEEPGIPYGSVVENLLLER